MLRHKSGESVLSQVMPQAIAHVLEATRIRAQASGQPPLPGWWRRFFTSINTCLRSAPSVMMPQLSEAFALSSTGRGLDRGAVLLRIFAIQPCRWRCHGSLGTEEGSPDRRSRGRRRGAAVRHGPQRSGERGQSTAGSWGSICTCGSHLHRHQELSASRAATLIGATQMFGMAGGSAGQFAVGPMIGAGIAWDRFWIGMGVVGLAMGALLFALPTEREENRAVRQWVKKHHGRVLHRIQESAIDIVRRDCRPAFHSNDNLRHGMGRALPPGSAWLRLCLSGHAHSSRSIRVDHWLPVARLHFRPARDDENQ